MWILIQAYGAQGVLAAVADDPSGVFFTAISSYVGGWAAGVMHVLIVTSVLAAQIAFHNAINRYVYALAREGVLPAAFTRVHPRHRSPWVAGAAQTALAVVIVTRFVMVDADPYTQLLLWVNTPGIVGLLVLQLPFGGRPARRGWVTWQSMSPRHLPCWRIVSLQRWRCWS